jgi:hypothetical protein
MAFGVAQGGWQVPVVAGHFSKTATDIRPVFATRHFPTTVVWHLTGTLSGNQASGLMQWSFAGPTKDECTPSSGSFTWHAKKTSKIGNA